MIENLLETLEKLRIYDAKVKKVLDADKIYLLYSTKAKYGVECWFNNPEVESSWNLRFDCNDPAEAEKLGFELTPEEKKILREESYTVLGFDKE